MMAQTDHDRLIRIDENVNMILTRLEKYDLEMDALQDEVGGIKQFQARMIGLAGGISFVVSLIWSQFGKLMGGA
jgi:hypothetical protein